MIATRAPTTEHIAPRRTTISRNRAAVAREAGGWLPRAGDLLPTYRLPPGD